MKLIHAILPQVYMTLKVFLHQYHERIEGSDTYQWCTGCLGNFAKQKHSERRMTLVHVVSVERSRPPTQEGVGACK